VFVCGVQRALSGCVGSRGFELCVCVGGWSRGCYLDVWGPEDLSCVCVLGGGPEGVIRMCWVQWM
jgi:hypothetical protein